jgi:hypothetical protein
VITFWSVWRFVLGLLASSYPIQSHQTRTIAVHNFITHNIQTSQIFEYVFLVCVVDQSSECGGSNQNPIVRIRKPTAVTLA